MPEPPTLYETMYILDTELDDAQVAEQIGQIERVVAEAGGEVVATRDFRTRRLAYEIDGHTHGMYKLLYFHGTAEVVEALNTDLKTRMSVIRSRTFAANPEAIVGGGSEEERAERGAHDTQPQAKMAEAVPEEAEQ